MMQTLSPDRAGEILAEMPVDDAVAALRLVEEGHGAALLQQFPTARAAELRRLLALPARTAGGLMTTASDRGIMGEHVLGTVGRGVTLAVLVLVGACIALFFLLQPT
jgi:hypothetical protein